MVTGDAAEQMTDAGHLGGPRLHGGFGDEDGFAGEVTDLVDGYIARRFGQQTVVGTIIDPMADKTLMTVGVVCLALKSAIPCVFLLFLFSSGIRVK